MTSIHSEIQRHGEFMLQNHEGNWVLLNDLEARKYTRRKLLEQDPLVGVLGRRMRELGSELRHGRGRHTALSRHHSPALLFRLEEIVYQEKPEQRKEKYSGKTADPFSFRWKIPEVPRHVKSLTTKRTFGMLSLEGFAPYNWSIGDYVIAFDGNQWLEGKIEKIFKVSRQVFFDVALANDEHLRGISETLLRFYNDGMIVEGALQENEDEPASRIVRVTSEGDYEIEEL